VFFVSLKAEGLRCRLKGQDSILQEKLTEDPVVQRRGRIYFMGSALVVKGIWWEES